MPRLPEPRSAALRELARQLRFQPTESSFRQLLRAEELALQLLTDPQPDRLWPVEWVAFKITAFRSDTAPPELSGTIPSPLLLPDLAALIQLLSAAAKLPEASLHTQHPGRWLTVEELAKRWNVSRQSLSRYRTLGLFSRRVEVALRPGARTAPQRTLFDLRVIEAFELAHPDQLKRAGAFSRTQSSNADRLYRLALRLRKRSDWSLTRIAQSLAPKAGRSIGAVRRAILEADARAAQPAFAPQRRARSTTRAQVAREFSRGTRAKDIALSAGRSRASVYRMVASERARRLRALDLTAPARPDFADPAAAHKLLASPHVTSGLGQPLPHTIADLLQQATETEPAAARERAIGSAYTLLRFQAAQRIAALGPTPTILGDADGRGGLDEIETGLRWAARLKAELVRSQLGLLIRTIDSRFDRPLAALPGANAAELVGALAAALCEAADRHDPFKGGRLAAPAGIALNRAAANQLSLACARDPSGPAPARALAKPAPSHARLDHIWNTLTPWTLWLDPPAAARERIDLLEGRARQVVIARLGWDTKPPRQALAVSRELGLSTQTIFRTEHAALRRLLSYTSPP